MTDERAPSDAEVPETIELLIYEHRRRRRVVLPSAGQVVIGRSADCDVRLEDSSISRRHAALYLGRGELEDLGSKNGSWLFPGGSRDQELSFEDVADSSHDDGLPLDAGKRYPFELGDLVKLGNVVVGFTPGARGANTEPIRDEEGLAAGDIVLADPVMRELYELAARAATTAAPVLVLGETGTGKGVLAEHVHRCSLRRAAPFVRVNCGALSQAMLEAQLFGEQRDAASGSSGPKPGLLALGHGGSVLLDEVDELPLATQTKLLHVLDSAEGPPAASASARRVNVRFIAATHADLAHEVQLGRFRKDLYYRLSGVVLNIVPLRSRPTEIEPLARFFLRRFCTANSLVEPELTPAAARHLLDYAWPGNLRELRNVMERATILCGAGPILPAHLPADSELTVARRGKERLAQVEGWGEDEVTMTRARRDDPAGPAASDDARIAEALRLCAGNQTRAAKLLGISRRTLVNRLNEYHLPRPRKRVV